MSYQVLARKWRPNKFAELVGQEHVVTAISNALDNDRLHHAYLFTGTRGVGKTTIARIFSKSLNCERGLGSRPCGECSTCVEIEQGNFIDLLEIDAASRTKVEDTRELLDNVQYRPSRGRYKVYLIDEVHMLSKHSFNALLKTLEEPPPHVKFLLATTDPQKLPVTILSRCLQFNLKALSRSQISQQLVHILAQEKIANETEALSQLARAAQGSMRDALSLTDQAIAQGNGQVSLAIVTAMLGLMDKNKVLKLLHAILQKENSEVLQIVEQMAVQAADYAQVLAELMSLLHQVALTQLVPEACKLETVAAKAIYELAKAVTPEHVQLLYQIALTGKKDLPYAAEPRIGLEMTLLRMLAFSPSQLTLAPLEIAALSAQVAAQQTIPSVKSEGVAQLVEGVSPPAESKTSGEQVASIEANVEAQAPPHVVERVATIPQDGAHSASSASSSSAASSPMWDADEEEHTWHDDEPNPEEDYAAGDLFAQQEAIVLQAQVMTGQGETPHTEKAPSNIEPDLASLNTTESLIALRKKLQQTAALGEDANESPKKSGNTDFSQLAAIREHQANKQTAVEKPLIQPPPQAVQALDTQPQPQDIDRQDDIPPWSMDEDMPYAAQDRVSVDAELSTAPIKQDQSVTMESAQGKTESLPAAPMQAAPMQVAPMQAAPMQAAASSETVGSDSHGEYGEVNAEIPLFLADQAKVVLASQVDDWSRLIESMPTAALTKQLALHSAFKRQGDTIVLELLHSKAHLNTPSAIQQLGAALSEYLGQTVNLEIQLGRPNNTPFGLQQKINSQRQAYARQVVNTDENIAQLQSLFAAKVDQDSIQAR
jgi:DNA polymerase III subunit gamma/tau